MTKGIYKTSKKQAGIFSLFIFTIFTFLASEAHSNVLDRIVAVVNDEIITLKELDNAVSPFMKRIKAQSFSQEKEIALTKKLKTDMLDKMIDDKLTEQAMAKVGIRASQEDLDRFIARFKDNNNLDDESLRKGLERDGLTMEMFRNRVRMQLLRPRLINQEINAKVIITEEDVEKYYNKNIGIYAGLEKFRLRNIAMFTPAGSTDADKREIAQKMGDVLVALDKGGSFADLASRHTESGLKAEGGDLGEFTINELSPQLQGLLAGKEAGWHTQVLDTEQGFQIFYIESKSTTQGKSIEDVKSEISEILYKERVDIKFKNWLTDLRANSVVQIME